MAETMTTTASNEIVPRRLRRTFLARTIRSSKSGGAELGTDGGVVPSRCRRYWLVVFTSKSAAQSFAAAGQMSANAACSTTHDVSDHIDRKIGAIVKDDRLLLTDG